MSSYLADLKNLHLWLYTLQGCLSSLMNKIIEMFVQPNPKKLKLKRVGEYVDGVNSIKGFQKKFRLLVKI